DGDGEFRCSLVVGPEGETRLHLHGSPAVSLHDEEGQPRAVLGLDEHTGMANLSYADAEGKCCLLLAEDPGGGRLHLFQRAGQGRRIPACDPGDPDAAGGALVPAREQRPQPPPVPARAGRARRLSVALVTFVAAFAGTLGGRLAPLEPGAPVVAPPAPVRMGPVLQAEGLLLSDRGGPPRARPSAPSHGTPPPRTRAPSGPD